MFVVFAMIMASTSVQIVFDNIIAAMNARESIGLYTKPSAHQPRI